MNLLRKVQLQIAVNENFVEPTINAIINGGRTGTAGEIGVRFDATEYERLDAIATETAKTLWGLLRKMSDTATRYPVA